MDVWHSSFLIIIPAVSKEKLPALLVHGHGKLIGHASMQLCLAHHTAIKVKNS